jgi:glycosyltransferase involved in cell wall biosynthesis
VRPQWSVVIPTHNCAAYLETCLASVLGQDPGSQQMEILVVDDHSTLDDPERVVNQLGGGRVKFLRQVSNVGKARNYETGLNAAVGHLIHQLHGDDLVRPGFYEHMQRAFEAFPTAGAFFCQSQYIDAEGNVMGATGRELETTAIIDNWLEKIVLHQRIQAPSMVVRRHVYETLGGFDRRLDCFEDWEMWIRIATEFDCGFNTESVAQYRVYPQNTSYLSILSGRRTRILGELLQIVDAYLPSEVLARCQRQRSRDLAHYLIRCIPTAIANGSLHGWYRLCRETIRYSVHPRVVYYLLLFTLRYKQYLSPGQSQRK